MSSAHDGVFLTEAARLGRRLVRAAIRHDGRATWLADRYVTTDGAWHRATGTLDGDVASGTAGVGLFLAHLAAVTGAPHARDTAVEALRHALCRADALLADRRLGWYDGALGVVGAAMLGGRALGDDGLAARATALAARALDTLPAVGGPPGLLDGSAGVIVGLLAVATMLDDARIAERVETAAGAIAARLAAAGDDAAGAGASPPPAGLAIGGSGSGLALAAWATHGSHSASAASAGAAAALDAERRWLQPGAGWWCAPPHPWQAWDPQAHVGTHRAWCAGAAGIGVARLLAYAVSHEARFLAEGAAAIELVREPRNAAEVGADASVCHGWAGEIELLLVAASLLNERAHLTAARALAGAYLAAAPGVYASGLWPGARAPGLLHGLAGVGLTLLRLHDPRCAPSPGFPPCTAAGWGGPRTPG